MSNFKHEDFLREPYRLREALVEADTPDDDPRD